MERSKYPLHESMRGYFGYELHCAMAENKDIYLLTGDLGYGMLDPHKTDYPDRFINCGASETTMMGIATGLAQEGKRPFTYTISSFYLRGAEPIALYIAREKLPVVMIGSGRDDDYKHDGPSHNGINTQEYMRLLGIRSLYPETKEEMADIVRELSVAEEPVFLSLRR